MHSLGCAFCLKSESIVARGNAIQHLGGILNDVAEFIPNLKEIDLSENNITTMPDIRKILLHPDQGKVN